jgi:hypothetical protein
VVQFTAVIPPSISTEFILRYEVAYVTRNNKDGSLLAYEGPPGSRWKPTDAFFVELPLKMAKQSGDTYQGGFGGWPTPYNHHLALGALMSDFGKGFSICAQVHAGVLRRVPPAFCQLVTQCVTNWRYRAFLRLATQRVTFLSALPLRWRHGALGKFILICPRRIIGPCSRSSAETRAISMRTKASSTAGRHCNWSAKSGRCCSNDCSKAGTRRASWHFEMKASSPARRRISSEIRMCSNF